MVLTDSARARFSDITDWVFDLDNTLYPRECNLFSQIDLLISSYMVDVTGLPYAQARALQKSYYRDHGTTLHGLMLHHAVDPEHAAHLRMHRLEFRKLVEPPNVREHGRRIACFHQHRHIVGQQIRRRFDRQRVELLMRLPTLPVEAPTDRQRSVPG